MHRLFGKKKETAPPPTLNDAQVSIGNRLSQHEDKIVAIDRELVNMKQQMQRMKPGTPAHNQLKNRAMTLLKQKKMYEKQRDSMWNQQFNIDQQKFTQESLKDTAVTVAAMKEGNKQLKQEFKKIDIDEIDDLFDDMAEFQDLHNEIQDAMGQSLDNELYDDDELMAELDGLENEMFNEEFDEVPNYLINATTAEKNAQRQNAQPQQQQQQSQYDSSGRPQVRNIPL